MPDRNYSSLPDNGHFFFRWLPSTEENLCRLNPPHPTTDTLQRFFTLCSRFFTKIFSMTTLRYARSQVAASNACGAPIHDFSKSCPGSHMHGKQCRLPSKTQKTTVLPGQPFPRFRLMGQHPHTPLTETASLAAHRNRRFMQTGTR